MTKKKVVMDYSQTYLKIKFAKKALQTLNRQCLESFLYYYFLTYPRDSSSRHVLKSSKISPFYEKHAGPCTGELIPFKLLNSCAKADSEVVLPFHSI